VLLVTGPVTRNMEIPLRRTYDAAPEPKEQKWYDSGHHLPDQAYDDAAKWIAQTWETLTGTTTGTTR